MDSVMVKRVKHQAVPAEIHSKEFLSQFYPEKSGVLVTNIKLNTLFRNLQSKDELIP